MVHHLACLATPPSLLPGALGQTVNPLERSKCDLLPQCLLCHCSICDLLLSYSSCTASKKKFSSACHGNFDHRQGINYRLYCAANGVQKQSRLLPLRLITSRCFTACELSAAKLQAQKMILLATFCVVISFEVISFRKSVQGRLYSKSVRSSLP